MTYRHLFFKKQSELLQHTFHFNVFLFAYHNFDSSSPLKKNKVPVCKWTLWTACSTSLLSLDVTGAASGKLEIRPGNRRVRAGIAHLPSVIRPNLLLCGHGAACCLVLQWCCYTAHHVLVLLAVWRRDNIASLLSFFFFWSFSTGVIKCSLVTNHFPWFSTNCLAK